MWDQMQHIYDISSFFPRILQATNLWSYPCYLLFISRGNRFVKVERCRGNPQRKRKSEFLSEPKKLDGCFSAYIGNLSWDVTEDDIRECFEESKISSVRFAFDKRTGEFRGFGHVDFEDDESLEEAMKKNQVELHGRPMKIAYAVSNRN